MSRSRTAAALMAGALIAVLLPTALAAGYNFANPSVNFDTYYNVTMDISDMQRLALAGDFAQANAVYTSGRNAYRNLALGTFRIARGVATAGAGHTGEAYYEMFKAFYNTTTFLDSWLGAALNGTGEYAASQAFRAHSVATYASVYGWIYILHEADVGTLFMRGFTSPVRNIFRNPSSASVEIDDAYTLYFGKGTSNPSSPMATALNAANSACISASRVAAQMQGVIDGFNDAVAAAVTFRGLENTTANSITYGAAYQAGRDKMVHYYVRSWVQMALASVRRATRASSAAVRKGYQAKAVAAFRAVAPFINSQPGGPVTVQRSFDAIKTIRASSFGQLKAALSSFYSKQGIDLKSTIFGC